MAKTKSIDNCANTLENSSEEKTCVGKFTADTIDRCCGNALRWRQTIETQCRLRPNAPAVAEAFDAISNLEIAYLSYDVARTYKTAVHRQFHQSPVRGRSGEMMHDLLTNHKVRTYFSSDALQEDAYAVVERAADEFERALQKLYSDKNR
jgi:hypothetical protein